MEGEGNFKTYDEALLKTISSEPASQNKFRRIFISLAGRFGFFQLLTVLFYILYKNSSVLFLFGLGFLTRPAKNYECYHEESDRWSYCSKEEICSKGIPGTNYRPIEDDEYIHNWVGPEKLDLLCQSKFKIGLLGSMYFIGIVSTILIWPWISDKWFGRRSIFLITGLIFICGFIGLIAATDILWAFVFMFLCGACFGGRIIVGLNYVIELVPAMFSQRTVFFFCISEPILLIMMTFWY